jgi:hypothetical protein
MMDNPQKTFEDILASEEKNYAEILSKIDSLLKERDLLEDRISSLKKLISSYSGSGTEEIKTQGQRPTLLLRRTRFPSAASAIKSLIDRQTDEYTVQVIQGLFEREFPNLSFSRNSFHVVVNKMVEEGLVKIIEKGVGTNPSRYRNMRQPSILD